MPSRPESTGQLATAGRYRRTPAERADQRLSWHRPDQAFFAAGACHILAWVCRDYYSAQSIGLSAMRMVDERQVFHTFATWGDWAFDHSGWHPAGELVQVNEGFEARALVVVEITSDLAEFCTQHKHRMPHQYHRDPRPRARRYVRQFAPPWE